MKINRYHLDRLLKIRMPKLMIVFLEYLILGAVIYTDCIERRHLIISPGAAPAIGAKSPEAKTPVNASEQERRRSSLPAVRTRRFWLRTCSGKRELAPLKKRDDKFVK
ncbi:MAG: hypothetical protein EA358_09595 [Flavobacteriales bacterium]|nr:MAG: hypothetical protein EA358_09595 [Flavobacteriales bacterium]